VKGVRKERLEEEIRNELADILLSRVGDPRLRPVIVSRVEAAGDLGHARVYISVLGSDAAQEGALRVLVHAGPFLRHELSRRLRARRVPELSFRADPGIRYSARVQEILRELGMVHEISGSAQERATEDGAAEEE
jgi:ribosome-binding factor A